uniref:Uncharacterized protein n=1 Tax=Heterorhabditis bacteriophora TaxID=37862 RepID=A0A1I7X898_HETBA
MVGEKQYVFALAMTPEQLRSMSAKADEERRRHKNQNAQNATQQQQTQQNVIVLNPILDPNAQQEKIYRCHADAPIRKLTCDLIKTYKNINEDSV